MEARKRRGDENATGRSFNAPRALERGSFLRLPEEENFRPAIARFTGRHRFGINWLIVGHRLNGDPLRRNAGTNQGLSNSVGTRKRHLEIGNFMTRIGELP